MKNEKILKTIIIIFAGILIVLSTFVYGNIQRAKQKTANDNKAVVVPAQTETSTKLPDVENKPKSPNQATPTVAVVPSASQPTGIKTPATGASDAVIPLTIISVLAYIYISSLKKTSQLTSAKSLVDHNYISKNIYK